MYKYRIIEKYNLIKSLDEELVKISDSSFGLDEKDIVKIDGKIYTNKFLDSLKIVNYIKKNTEFNNINYILELGAGIGMLASVLLKLKKKLKYLIVDIPPVLFFSEYYLKNIGYKVFGYEDFSKKEKLNIKEIFENYDVICLPTWAIEKISHFEFDLFINEASFQEMEKKQALNYISIFKSKINKYIYLTNSITGHHKASNKNDFGVLEQTSFDTIKDHLTADFEIKKKEFSSNNYQVIFEKKK
tara:strand:- start:63 stop:794 length:732 start_codon:yes stop_codon:yes gene_type:complete